MTRWHVYVVPVEKGRKACVMVVKRRRLFRPAPSQGIRVATLSLMADDAERQLAEARARARSIAGTIRQLEGGA